MIVRACDNWISTPGNGAYVLQVSACFLLLPFFVCVGGERGEGGFVPVHMCCLFHSSLSLRINVVGSLGA